MDDLLLLHMIYDQLNNMWDPDIHIVIENIAQKTKIPVNDLYNLYDNHQINGKVSRENIS